MSAYYPLELAIVSSATPGVNGWMQNYIVQTVPRNNNINVMAYSGNTTAHELGHQLDIIWGRPSSSNANWLKAVSLDEAAFNAQTCANAIDNYVPQGGTLYCKANPGLTNWQIYTTKILNLSVNTVNEELWANAFVRANGPAPTIPLIEVITAQFANQASYMQTVATNGVP